jgi:AhpD family alkylhydroperoxidase
MEFIMEKRINIQEVTPAGYKAMMALENYACDTSVNPIYREMIKIRVSQINGCAYCVDMHTKDARELGESERRIYALSAWRESPLFSDEERAILSLTDEMANISVKGVAAETYDKLKKYFDDQTIAEMIMINVAINSWNRIAVSTHLQHKN